MNNQAIKVENLRKNLDLQAVQGISFGVYTAGLFGPAVWRFRFE